MFRVDQTKDQLLSRPVKEPRQEVGEQIARRFLALNNGAIAMGNALFLLRRQRLVSSQTPPALARLAMSLHQVAGLFLQRARCRLNVRGVQNSARHLTSSARTTTFSYDLRLAPRTPSRIKHITSSGLVESHPAASSRSIQIKLVMAGGLRCKSQPNPHRFTAFYNQI
jgi:hypothetical protein